MMHDSDSPGNRELKDRAADGFRSEMNCAQAVLSVFCEREGLSTDLALRLAGPFGAGMGRRQETCGALTGALMAYGLRCKGRMGDPGHKDAVYAGTRDIADRFQARHGSTDCRALLGCPLATPEGQERFKREGLKESICMRLVESAVELVEEMK
jgi:C_GCAxxG_C_C family probable redox protein